MSIKGKPFVSRAKAVRGRQCMCTVGGMLLAGTVLTSVMTANLKHVTEENTTVLS